ncbi:MAG TPA: hypothetical protein DCR90_02705 [Fusobacteriaceae bacterium]|nr:hypothetical protein [Fusobacteriaceae bacterium]
MHIRRKTHGIDKLIQKKEDVAYRIIINDFKKNVDSNITKEKISKIFKIKGKRYERHKILDLNFTHTDSKWIKVLFKNCCFNCGSKKNLQIDHHLPLSLGYGLKFDNKYNAVLLCKKCNNKKSNLLPSKFYTLSQLKILETTYHIDTHKKKYLDNSKNIAIENLIDIYEKQLQNKSLIYLNYLDHLWNSKKYLDKNQKKL